MKLISMTYCGLLTTLCLFAGCGDSSGNMAANDASDEKAANSARKKADVHEHPSTGPHHGELIELGKEEFHAELVHDEQSVTIYLLDSSAKQNVPIEAGQVIINLKSDGAPRQFELPASPTDGDPEGKSSRFTLADGELAALVDDPAADPSLNVTINGTAYRGRISHHHHAGHNDAH